MSDRGCIDRNFSALSTFVLNPVMALAKAKALSKVPSAKPLPHQLPPKMKGDGKKPRGARTAPGGEEKGDGAAMLIDAIALQAGIQAKETKDVIDAMRNVAAREIGKNGRVRFPSFFIGSVKHFPERPVKVKKMSKRVSLKVG